MTLPVWPATTTLLPLALTLIGADDNGDELPLIVTLYAGCGND